MRKVATSVMDNLTSLLRESILVQALITASVVLTLCAMYFLQRPIPPEFFGLATLIIGHYFGMRSNARSDTVLSKAQALINRKENP